MKRDFVIIGLFVAVLALPASARVVFVDSSARGANNGDDWDNAFNNLQDALDFAQPGYEIWVANGAYVPERDRDGNPTTGPDATFVLKSPGVKILGGFAGDEANVSQRNPLSNSTVLDGEGQKWHVVYVDDKFDVDLTTRFDGFTIRGGYGNGVLREDRFGAGMYVINAGLTIANCTFVENFAELGGAGLYHEGPQLNIANCRFVENRAGNNAAGGGVLGFGPMQLANCLFVGNVIGDGGFGGGAAFLCTGSNQCIEPSVRIAHSTFYSNMVNGAVGLGGGLFGMSHVRISNSIIWGNLAPNFPSIGYTLIGPVASFCDIEGNYPGDGNFSAFPAFEDPDAGNFRLQRGSPCVGVADFGSLPLDFADLDGNNNTTEYLPFDLDLTPRDWNGLSLGCYESSDCNRNFVSDYTDLERCNGNPVCSDCNFNGVLDACDAAIQRIYVDSQAYGGGAGDSWETAFYSLSDALCVAAVPGSQVREIWVRAGIYTPAYEKGADRTATFRIPSGVAVLGGFAGFEAAPSQRNIAANPTVLSGDQYGDDIPPFKNNSENSFHVVTAQNAGSGTALDGFIIIGGNAEVLRDGIGAGGGLLVVDSTLSVRDCFFFGNYAQAVGGAIGVLGSSSVLIQRGRFDANDAENGAAVASTSGGIATIANSTFRINSPVRPAAVVAATSQSLVNLESCTFTANLGSAAQASSGGVISVRNSILWGNVPPTLAEINGGVINVRFSNVQGGAPGDGNIDADPLFESLTSLALQPGSPCIDAGDPFTPPLDLGDAAGAPRTQQCRTDMGALESTFFADCNANDVGDACELQGNPLLDCNGNARLDACEPDSDADGVPDECDNCPNDAAKSAPGACGCGIADIDTDGDGIPDCIDNCPTRPNSDQFDGNTDGAGDACDSRLRLEGCPGDIQVASSDNAGTTVSFAMPQPVDGYGEVSLTATQQPGDFFAIGNTQVTFTATDTAGGLATCSFQVIVLAPEEPNRPSPDPNDCPPLYRANNGALRFFGVPFGCGPGCLVAIPLTIVGILGMKRRRR